MSHDLRQPAELRMSEVTRTWWPLAASWMMMGLELPALNAAVARMADPQVNLAAFGGLVFPLALIIESPIIMMLAASTALSRDIPSYQRLRRFMWQTSAALTALHALVAFTPLFDLIALKVIGVPVETVQPGRLGMQMMLPWTWAIADRRFHQGVLIRFGRSRAVGVGTLVRLVATCSALFVGYQVGTLPGIVVAAGALSFGVLVEATYARVAVSPILRHDMPEHAPSPKGAPPGLLAFYVPLAMTPLLQLLALPIGSAAISRMPSPLLALAAWPALNGLIFLVRASGIAYNEVVVSLCERPGADAVLRRFAVLMGAVLVLVLLVVAATPLGRVWFSTLCGLDEQLTALALPALWLGLLLPALGVATSLYQGFLTHAHRTRAIPESMALFVVVIMIVFGGGIAWQQVSGL
ncbi:MAG: hypothetical protein ACYTGC_17975, partial [Planctomycetota bacterium]